MLTRGKQLALLVYLCAANRRTASRPLLVDLLWSDSDELAGRHSLRNALTEIRRTIGADAICTEGDTVTLSSVLRCDRDLFLAAISSSDAASAVAAYCGAFLPDFALPDCGEFERWADLERRQLRTAFLRCAEGEVRRALDAARWRDAQRIARKARDEDVTNERAWRLLLESLLSGGDTVEAAMEALRLQSAWQDDEQEPEPDTARLVAVALGSSLSVATLGASRDAEARRMEPDMVGRAVQFSVLLGAWERVGKPRGTHLHIEASAGFGKSRLLAEFRRRLRTTRARVVMVQASISDRDLSYSLASELAAALAQLRGASGISSGSASTLVALNPSLAAFFDARPDEATGEEALRRRSLALEELLAAVSEERPLALLVDDIHWADTTSERILLRLARRAPALSCLLVTAARPGGSFAMAVEQHNVLALTPLSVLDIAELVASLGTLPTEPWVPELAGQLLVASLGTPLLVIATLAHLCDVGALCVSNRTWQCFDAERLRTALVAGEALRLRTASLEPLDASVMFALAALGGAGELTLVCTVVGQDQEVIRAALLRLERSGFVRRASAEQWVCAHDEIAATILREAGRRDTALGHVPLTEVHGRIAEAFLRDDDNLIALRRAGVHALAAADEVLLGRAVRRWSLLRRAAGDRRSARAQVREFLGTGAEDEAQVARIASLLPARPLALQMVLGAAGLLLGMFAIAMLRPGVGAAQRESTVTLIGHSAHEDIVTGLERDVTVGRIAIPDSLRDNRTLLFRPGSRSDYAFSASVADSGETELFVSDSGHVRRLTFARGDDLLSDWSPDGRSILITTGRWDRTDWYADIAIVDAHTGAVRPLVKSTGFSESGPRWSPDGGRVAFVRRSMTTMAPDQYCTISVTGADEACGTLRGYPGLMVAAWRGPDQLVLVADSASEHHVVDVDIARRIDTHVDTRRGNFHISPDGIWEICDCLEGSANHRIWLLSRLGDHADIRTLNVPEGNTPVNVIWQLAPRLSLARLRIITRPNSIPLEQTYHLQSAGSSIGGEPLPLASMRWSSSDSSVAIVDSSGVLHPRRSGTLVVRATSGWWIRDSVRISIVGSPSQLVWEASWAPSDSGWRKVRAFGDPRPVAVPTDHGWAFMNNGDGSYSSGAYSVDAWSPDAGLSLETTIQLPLTRSTWQSVAVGFTAGLTDARLAQWDHRSNRYPTEPLAPLCMVTAPPSEGPAGIGFILLTTATEYVVIPSPPSFAMGNWMKVRLDVYADGSCSLSLDGKPAAGVRGVRSILPRRFITSGQSFKTKALIGAVKIWRGTAPPPSGTAR